MAARRRLFRGTIQQARVFETRCLALPRLRAGPRPDVRLDIEIEIEIENEYIEYGDYCNARRDSYRIKDY